MNATHTTSVLRRVRGRIVHILRVMGHAFTFADAGEHLPPRRQATILNRVELGGHADPSPEDDSDAERQDVAGSGQQAQTGEGSGHKSQPGTASC